MQTTTPRPRRAMRTRRRGVALTGIALTAAITLGACDVTPTDQTATPADGAVTAQAVNKVWAGFDTDLQGWTVTNGTESWSNTRTYTAGGGALKVVDARSGTAAVSAQLKSPSINEDITKFGPTLATFVKLEDGSATGTHTARLSVRNTAGTWSYGPAVTLTAGKWVRVAWNPPASLLASKRNVGVSLDTKNVNGNVTWYVDNFIQESATVAPTVAPTTVKPTTTVAPTTTAKPTTTTTVKPTTTTVAPWRAAYPGDVSPGKIRWGSSIGGNADPAKHEDFTAKPLGIRRTFYGWGDRTGKMVTTAKGDIAAGRVPWVSIKPPTVSSGSAWQAIGDGKYDADIDAMLRALDGAGGPVWFTLHHEPEGGGGSINGGPDDIGGAAQWRRAQARIRARMTAVGTKNVAFAPILMAWTFDSRSGRTGSDWWVDGIWDFYGIDTYAEDEANAGPQGTQMFKNAHTFITGKKIDWAIGEWGNRGTDAAAAAEMQGLYDIGVGSASSGKAQLVGISAFDSGLNAPNGSWELFGEPLTKFRQLVDAPTAIGNRQN